MPEKANAKVVIDGKVYTLSGYEQEAYLQKVASYIDGKIVESNRIKGFKNMSFDQKSIMIHLNIADDYFKAKDQVNKLEQELKLLNKEVFDLKQELVSTQMKLEEAILDDKTGKYDKHKRNR